MKRIIFSLIIVAVLVMVVLFTANLPPVTVAQPEPLKLECRISPNPTEVGNITDFRAAASDGVPPYTWSWTVNGTEVGAGPHGWR